MPRQELAILQKHKFLKNFRLTLLMKVKFSLQLTLIILSQNMNSKLFCLWMSKFSRSIEKDIRGSQYDRIKGKAGTGNVSYAVQHLRTIRTEIEGLIKSSLNGANIMLN